MRQDLGGNSGSREPDPSFTGSGPTGFDPGRKKSRHKSRDNFVKGTKSASQLASRARDLEARGLVQSRWVSHYTNKEWRRAIAAGARSDETNEDLAQSEGRQSGGKAASPKVQS